MKLKNIKKSRKKESKNNILKIILLCFIILLFSLYFYFYTQETKLVDFCIEYKSKINVIESYGSIKRSTITNYISLNGVINKIDNETSEYKIDKNNQILCEIGSIINSNEDVSTSEFDYEFSKGRVLNIVENENEYIIYIDNIKNYEITIEMSSDYYDVYKNLIIGNEYSVQIPKTMMVSTLKNKKYDEENDCYIINFMLNDFNQYVFDGANAVYKVLEKEYKNAKYIAPEVIKEITNDDYVIISEIINDDGIEKLVDKKYKMIDRINDKIIIEIDDFVSKKLFIYNYYK